MQGKERNQTRIDAPFTDHAWQQMRNMLDQEMPVAVPAPPASPKKSYALLLLFLLFGFLIGVGTMKYFDRDSLPVEDQNIETTQEIAAVETTIENNEFGAATTIAKASALGGGGTPSFSNQGKDRLSDSPLNNAGTGQTPKENSSKQNHKQQNNLDFSSNSSFAIVHQKNPVFEEENSQPSEIEPVLFSNIATENLKHNQIFPESDEQDLQLSFVELNQKENIHVGVRLGHLSRRFNDFAGISTGAFLDIPLDQGFAFQTGIQYSMLCGFQKSADISEINLSPFKVDNSQGRVNLDQLSTIQPLGENKELPISKLHYLDLPVVLTYQPLDKVKIHMGLKGAFLLHADADIDASYGTQGTDPSTVLRSDENDALYESMKKFDLNTILGVGFYPTKNLGLDVRYNHGLIDNTIDEAWQARQITTNKSFEVALTYLFNL